MIECVPNSKSRDQLGQSTEATLTEYFVQQYGVASSSKFQEVRVAILTRPAAPALWAMQDMGIPVVQFTAGLLLLPLTLLGPSFVGVYLAKKVKRGYLALFIIHGLQVRVFCILGHLFACVFCSYAGNLQL